MNTNTKTATKAAEGRKKAAEQAAEPKTATNATNATKTAEKAGKEGKNMKTTKTTKAAPKTAPKTEAEAVKTAAPKAEDNRAKRIAAALEAAKTANTPNARREAAEQAAELIADFNRESFANAVNRADMKKAAEALKPRAPKKDESRRGGFAYMNAEEVVTYQFMDEEGRESTRTLSLVQYAAAAFMKTATKEQAAAFAAALRELEGVNAAALEGREENGKNAAKALTALAAAVGLDSFTTKTAEDGKKYAFYIDRSFVYAAAAPLRVKRGEAKTAAAVLEAATLAALEAAESRRTRAESRRAKAEAAAVKAVFGIIAAAAEAAAVNVWKAYIVTAEGVREAWKKAAAEQAKREAERAAKKAEREAKKTETNAEKAAKLRERIEKDRAALAALEQAEKAKTAA